MTHAPAPFEYGCRRPGEQSPAAPGDHLVGFHDSDEAIVESMAAFLERALHTGGTAVAIATPLHRAGLRDALARRFDVTALALSGRLIERDVHEALAGVMDDDGVPHRERFLATVGSLLDQASVPGGPISVYGEMSAVLWEQGNPGGAIALEALTNELRPLRPFTTLCGYPLSAFATDSDASGLDRVCRQHSGTISRVDDAAPPGSEHARTDAGSQRPVSGSATERARLEADRQRLSTRVEHLERAVDTQKNFTSMVVHDLRSPASTVSIALQLLRADVDGLSSDAAELVDVATDGIARIERLADDLLTATRIEHVGFGYERRPMDLVDVVERAVYDLSLATGRQLVLVDRAHRGRVLADASRQRQILDNLLTNAVNYSPEGSTVHVELTRDATWATVSVRDQGPGIDPADHRAVFEPFTRLAASRVEGTGLGLYLVKTLVEGQGGTVRVESTPGHGATFSYTVPLAEAMPT